MSSNWGWPRAKSRTASSTRAIHCGASGASLSDEQRMQAGLAEFVRAGVFRFGNAIGVEEQEIAGRERGVENLHPGRIEHADRQAPAARISTLPSARRISGADGRSCNIGPRRSRIVGRVKQGREELAGVIVGEPGVGFQDRGRQVRRLAQIDADQRPGDAHEQRGRHPLAADIAYADRDPPVRQMHKIEKVAADITRRRHRRADVEAGLRAELGDLWEKRALDHRRARHLVVALAVQDKLVRHTPEGVTEISKIRDGMAQFLEQRCVELVTLKRPERVGVEADRAIEPAQAFAHPGDDVDQQRGRCMGNLEQRCASDAKRDDGGVRAHRRGARQLRQGARSPTSTGARRVEIGMTPRALSAVTITSPARTSMAQSLGSPCTISIACGPKVRRSPASIRSEIGFGKIAESARRPYGGAQLRVLDHIVPSSLRTGAGARAKFKDEPVHTIGAAIGHVAGELMHQSRAVTADVKIIGRPGDALGGCGRRIERLAVVNELDPTPSDSRHSETVALRA